MYIYFNIDEETLYDSETEMYDSFDGESYQVRAIPGYGYGAILIAAGRKMFSERQAVMTYRRISGDS